MKTGSNGLSYPFDNRPNPGQLIEVGPRYILGSHASSY